MLAYNHWMQSNCLFFCLWYHSFTVFLVYPLVRHLAVSHIFRTWFFLHLLTGVWRGLSVIGAYSWMKVSAVIATSFQKIRFIRDKGKFLKSIQMRKCSIILLKKTKQNKPQKANSWNYLEIVKGYGFCYPQRMENFCLNTFKLWIQRKIVCRYSVEISWFGSKFSFFSSPTEPPNSCVPESSSIIRKLKHFFYTIIYYFF